MPSSQLCFPHGWLVHHGTEQCSGQSDFQCIHTKFVKRRNSGLDVLGVILIEGIENSICLSTSTPSSLISFSGLFRSLQMCSTRTYVYCQLVLCSSNIISVHNVTCFNSCMVTKGKGCGSNELPADNNSSSVCHTATEGIQAKDRGVKNAFVAAADSE